MMFNCRLLTAANKSCSKSIATRKCYGVMISFGKNMSLNKILFVTFTLDALNCFRTAASKL